MSDPKDIVTPDDEIEVETLPDTTVDQTVDKGVSMTEGYLNHLTMVADNMPRFVEAKNKIQAAVMKLAKDGDWVVFESKAPDGTTKASVCLSGAGADRIGAAVGVSFTNWTAKREAGEDDKGKWYRWWYEVDAMFAGRTIRAMGRAGSRDKFFGKAHGEFKPLHDIDESNIKMAAYHNAMKEGIKLLFGLRALPLEDFKTSGIKLSYASKVSMTSNAPTKTTTEAADVPQKPFYSLCEIATFPPRTKAYTLVAELVSQSTKGEGQRMSTGLKLLDPAKNFSLFVNYFGSALEFEPGTILEMPVLVKQVGERKYLNTDKKYIKEFNVEDVDEVSGSTGNQD